MKEGAVNKIASYTSLHLLCQKFRLVENFWTKSYHYDFEISFYFQPIEPEKNLLSRNSTSRNVFSFMLLYCSVKSAYVLSAQKDVSFFQDILFQSKNKTQQTPMTNMRFREYNTKYTVPVFPKLFFVRNNKLHFLYYLHGRIFWDSKYVNNTASTILDVFWFFFSTTRLFVENFRPKTLASCFLSKYWV